MRLPTHWFRKKLPVYSSQFDGTRSGSDFNQLGVRGHAGAYGNQ
jgi:hypothetical protein